MTRKVKWGVLGVANIAVNKVIPAMRFGEWSEVWAIASRDLTRARQAAQQLGIPKAYGSYDELLADEDVEAIYNPLPNHLHVPWSIKAAAVGKHVLCEKPISLTVEEALSLLRARDRTGVKVEEAFMVRTHPQWLRTLDLIKAGRMGVVRSVVGYFSYDNQDLENVRYVSAYGGGGLMDIGCYLVYFSRLIFGDEPTRTIGLMEEHPQTSTDVLTSAILDFPSGHSIFTCGMRVVPYQRVQVLGTGGRIEIEIPVNAPPDQPCKLLIDDGSDLAGRGIEAIEIDPCDQYTVQGDLFSQCILEDKEPPLPLEESIKNMAVIEAIFRSAKSGNWEAPFSFGL